MPSIDKKLLSIFGLILFNVILCTFVVHLLFFAAKGARYTYQDGVTDRQINLNRYTELKSELQRIDQKLLQLQSAIK